METSEYVVQIWNNQNKNNTFGPDFEYRQIALTAEDAIRKVIQEKSIEGNFYAEVHLKSENDGQDHCWVYTEDMLTQ